MTLAGRYVSSWTGLSPLRCMLFAAALAVQEPAMSQAEPSARVVAASAAPVVLRRSAVTVPLVPAAGAAALRRRLAGLGAGRDIHLVIDGLQVEVDPGGLYRLELVGLANSTPAAGVGSFSVFGVAHAEGATAQRSFVVTAALREFADGGVAVRFVPDPATAQDACVRIGRITLVEQ